MATSIKSLNVQLTWTRVLPNLGINPPRVTILPQRVTCPFCQSEQLTLAEDHVLGGIWTSCCSCNFTGDLIELVAAVWQVEVPAAIAKLDGLGMFEDPISDCDVAEYLRDHVGYRRRLHQFWKTAQLAPMQHATPSVSLLLRKFGLLDASKSPMWPERAGRFIGSSTSKAVEELFSPLSYDDQPRANPNSKPSVRRGGGPGNRRIFKGHRWEDVLVVPFYDLPGRICGFLFVGREADPEAGDFVYKRANFGSNKQPVREAGVAMLPALNDGPGPDRNFGDTVFVIADPVVGLLLQTQRMRDSSVAFPLVLTYFSQQVQTLRLPPELEDRNLIFWGPHPQLLNQAKLHGGKVSRYHISPSEVERRLNHRHALDWLRFIERDAMHWRIAFRRELNKLDLPGVAKLVERMQFSPAEMRDLIQGSDEAQRERLIASDPYRLGHNRVLVNGKMILETDGGWVVEATGEQICNMSLRIEQVARTEDGDCYYVGRAKEKDNSIPFTLNKTSVDRRGLFECVREHLMERNAGLLNFQTRWAKHAENIAFQFHPPELVSGVGRIGWRSEERLFQFPKFSIAYGGKVKPNPLPIALSNDLPGLHLELTNSFSQRKQAAMSVVCPETSLIWAIMASVAHNLIAPELHRKPCGIVLDGAQMAATSRVIARELGCGIIDLSNRRRGQSQLDLVGEGSHRHDIPSVVRVSERSRLSVTNEWLDKGVLQNAILSLDGYQAVAVASHPGFVRIHAAAPVSPLGELKQAIRTLLPAWLGDACRRKLWIDQVAEHLVFDVLTDIARWFEKRNGNPKAVLAARNVLSVDSLAPASAFVRILDHLFACGQITTVRAGYDPAKRKTPPIVYASEAEFRHSSVWLPAMEINRILAEQKCPTLNLSTVAQALQTEDAWLCEGSYGELRGWAVDQHWFDSQLDHVRSNSVASTSRPLAVTKT